MHIDALALISIFGLQYNGNAVETRMVIKEGWGLHRGLFSYSSDTRIVFFQISTNQLRSSEILPSIRNEVLILTENETEKDRWVATLEELHKAAKQSTSQLVSSF